MTDPESYREKKKKRQRQVYAFNVLAAGTFGPLLLFKQKFFKKVYSWEYDDPIMMAIYGSGVLGVATLSAIALTNEKRYEQFLPVFYWQLLYKTLTIGFLAHRIFVKKGEKWGVWFIFLFFIPYVMAIFSACPWRKTD